MKHSFPNVYWRYVTYDNTKQTDAPVSAEDKTSTTSSTTSVTVLDIMNFIYSFQFEILVDDKSDRTTSREEVISLT